MPHRRRAGLVPSHHLHGRPADDRRPAQVVALDRRGEPVGRDHRPLGGRQPVPVRRPPPEPALDDAVARQLLRPDRPRAHDLPDHGPEERERDVPRAHAARRGRPGGRAVGRDAASEVPRADGDLARERRGRARYGQLAEPRPGRPRRRRRRRRPGDGQGRDGLGPRSRLQGRAAPDADAAVDGGRAARTVVARACVHDRDADRSRGCRRRGRLRRDDASDRPRARRDVAAERGGRPEREPAQPRPRRAGAPAWDAFPQRHGRHADNRPGPWTTRCPRRRGRCRRR